MGYAEVAMFGSNTPTYSLDGKKSLRDYLPSPHPSRNHNALHAKPYIHSWCHILPKKKVLDIGGNNGKRALEFYPSSDVTVVDLKTGWDVMERGLPDGDWDVILANHFIEHVSDPDYVLDCIKFVAGPNTIIDIGMPNLTAWFNRILFLFGYVPHSVELSFKHNVGKPFNWGKEEIGGHLRVFTIPAFLQLLKIHGFKIKEVKGEASTYNAGPIVALLDRALTAVNPNLASAFRVKCSI